jgi:HK97 gp10 family phage protein
MELTFKGGKEFARFLQDLPGAISAEILETSLYAGAAIVLARAQEKCPQPAVRRRPGTVRLVDSLRISTVEKDAAHAIVNVGTNVPYAHLVEFGHQIVARGPTRARVSVTKVSASGRITVSSEVDPDTQRFQTAGASGMVAARPFLRPAFDESREEVIRRVGESMGKSIEQEARRLAKVA